MPKGIGYGKKAAEKLGMPLKKVKAMKEKIKKVKGKKKDGK